MKQHQSVPITSRLLEELEPSDSFSSSRSESALNYLRSAFNEDGRLAVLGSGWRRGADYVVEQFIEALNDQVVVARTGSECASDSDALRSLIEPIGIDPEKIRDEDLEKVLVRFLACQKKDRRRTIFVLEESKVSGKWLHARLKRLMELEADRKFGVFVVVIRRRNFRELDTEVVLDDMCISLAKHISLTPFTLQDTRKFVRWRIDAAETADISKIFDLQAITLIHEMGNGLPDAIDALCCASLQLADDKDIVPLTTEIVMEASRALGLESKVERLLTVDKPLPTSTLASIPTLKVNEPPRIIVTYKGKQLRQLILDKERLSIGRSTDNDICIHSPFVSRQHAALVRDGVETAVIDLESQNGTTVNSNRVRAQTLSNGDEIRIGYHTIMFVDPEAPSRVSLNGSVRTRPKSTRYPARGFAAAGRNNGVAHNAAALQEPVAKSE